MKFNMGSVKRAFHNLFQNENTTLTGLDGMFPTVATISTTSYRRYAKNTITAPIFNRLAMDIAMCEFKHVKVDNKEDVEVVDSGLNYCLTEEANIDQSAFSFIYDVVYSLLDEGVVAIVPTDYETTSPFLEDGKLNPNPRDILKLRVGKVVDWYPKKVKVSVYNEDTGRYQDVIVNKDTTAIIESPLYPVINAENATLKRLENKIAQSDAFDPNRLDLIFQIPYSLRNDIMKDQVDKRLGEIKSQLQNHKSGMAYIDATEKVVQLNRSVQNQTPEEASLLYKQFLSELGMTESIFNGTAKEDEILIYYMRSVEPLLKAIISEMRRSFITKTARKQGYSINYTRDVFMYTTLEKLAQAADSLRRNGIMSANELRRKINLPRSNDDRADELFNPNIADANQVGGQPMGVTSEMMDQIADQIAEMEGV